jgi:hypothetical protein
MSEIQDDVVAPPPATGTPTRRVHWVRGALWGLSLGIGLAIYAVIFRVIELHVLTMAMIVVLGVALGLVWARFGPAKH